MVGETMPSAEEMAERALRSLKRELDEAYARIAALEAKVAEREAEVREWQRANDLTGDDLCRESEARSKLEAELAALKARPSPPPPAIPPLSTEDE